MLTGRDAAHKRMVDMLNKGEQLPVDLKGRFIYYVGPVDPVRDEVVGPAGPTTATRMDKFTRQILESTGLLGMIGKSERGPIAIDAIRDNKVIGSGSNGISVHNESDLNGSITVSGNRVFRAGGKGIYVVNGTRGTTANYDDAIVNGNRIKGAAAEGIQIGYSTQPGKLLGATVTGNRVSECGGIGIYALHCRRLAITGNNVDGDADSSAIRVYDSLGYNVTGNEASMPAGSTVAAIRASATTAGATTWGQVSGNVVSAQSSSFTGAGVLLDNNVEYTGVTGNTLRGSGGVSLGTGAGNAQADNIT